MTTSSSDVLTFSRDTVNFDTVFTDLGTPTARLIVHNDAKKGLNITSIRFKRNDTEFRMNVDGQSGTEFRDVEIRGRDSIYVFIECFIPETQGANPGLIEDDIEFVTNGVTQLVHVEAYGQNVVRLRNVRLTNNMTMTADRPYVIFDSLYVERNATLKIEPGARVLFHDGASIVVEGRIDAVGEKGKMIDMRGDRLDNVLPDVGYDILAGQWKGIRIKSNSFDNRMEYVNMRSTVSGLTIDSCADLSRNKLTMVNSWLHNSQGTVLKAVHAKVNAYGCCFSEAADAVVSLTGGVHNFVQCTIANNYLFSAIRGAMLTLLHAVPDKQTAPSLPLMKANFENCIIYGLGADLNEGNLDGSNVYFRNVSLKSEGSNDEHFIDCLWDTDPIFYTDRPIYYFNYRLQPDSPVKSAGNPAYVTDIDRVDMDGVNRLSSGAPSLGAYQYVAPAE
ncbi:MAG: hypothetical protein NC204_04100 [Candidatus Amulumruptor caecigallinarius]|nr:hypothetical protein [Candidatus Amulumruptor caecigallinarius]